MPKEAVYRKEMLITLNLALIHLHSEESLPLHSYSSRYL